MDSISKYEISDDELEDVAGGIDFGPMSLQDVGAFSKALIAKDATKIKNLIDKFLFVGVQRNNLEALINKFSTSEEIKKAFCNYIRTRGN